MKTIKNLVRQSFRTSVEYMFIYDIPGDYSQTTTSTIPNIVIATNNELLFNKDFPHYLNIVTGYDIAFDHVVQYAKRYLSAAPIIWIFQESLGLDLTRMLVSQHIILS